jgi:hypothetical protein
VGFKRQCAKDKKGEKTKIKSWEGGANNQQDQTLFTPYKY